MKVWEGHRKYPDNFPFKIKPSPEGFYVSRANQIAALGYVSRTTQSVVFVLWFKRGSNFNEVIGDSARAGLKM